MEIAIKIIFWIVFILILIFVVACFCELGKIEDLIQCMKISDELSHDRFRDKLVDINHKCDEVLKNLDEKESDKEKEHFYLANDGYMKCRKTDKYISCSAIGFNNLDYCPFCGEKLRKE